MLGCAHVWACVGVSVCVSPPWLPSLPFNDPLCSEEKQRLASLEYLPTGTIPGAVI